MFFSALQTGQKSTVKVNSRFIFKTDMKKTIQTFKIENNSRTKAFDFMSSWTYSQTTSEEVMDKLLFYGKRSKTNQSVILQYICTNINSLINLTAICFQGCEMILR